MCEDHNMVNDYCSKHGLDVCYMIGYFCMSKSTKVIVLKICFGWNCEFFQF